MNWKMRWLAGFLLLALLCTSFSACGNLRGSAESNAGSSSSEKSLVIGDTSFNTSNEEPDVNPHNAYSGWACIRYGIGETLVRYSDDMKVEPWLAVSWENADQTTWRITLRDNVTFSSGRKMDAEAVKECLEHLISVHDRAPSDLKIASMDAEGQILTIHTSEPNPSLMNYLGDPYACIIDVKAGFANGIVAGTGPFIASSLKPDESLTLKKNKNYWDGESKLDQITVRTITDGNTLASALRSGEVQAAYGIAYESYPLFQNDDFNLEQISTSRCFFAKMNFDPSSVCSDPAVRKAIALGINKEGFVKSLLDGNGTVADGVFPSGMAFGGDRVQARDYDLKEAARVLKDAGWVDSDGDGIREKKGQKLVIKWLTYPSRQELPLLAEAAQASLSKIGMKVEINSTADQNEVVKDPSRWDVYAMANVNCPTGDPLYWFTVYARTGAAKNQGQYSNPDLDALIDRMSVTFDTDERNALALKMQQEVLDDDAFVFCAFLKMSMISQAKVKNYTPHACDYYQVTRDLDISQ